MGSQWTNKYAILRDLSYAQGRKVPAAIIAGGVGEKPPVNNFEEETEEEYIKNGFDDGDGELQAKPDLFMIKHMLDWVRDVDVEEPDNGDTGNVIEISKLNPLSQEFVPKNGVSDNGEKEIETKKVDNAPEHNNNQLIKPNKKRRERNVALLSLLDKERTSLDKSTAKESKGDLKHTVETSTDIASKDVKLLKPNDFFSEKTVIDAVEKVNEWLQAPAEKQTKKIKQIDVSPSSMFKKKAPKPLILESSSMFKRKSDSSSIKSSDSEITNKSNNQYVPSSHADEYYKKYVERSQMQRMVQEDIWKRAERVMKELDAKRLKEKEENSAKQLVLELPDSSVDKTECSLQEGTSRTVNANSESVNDAETLAKDKEQNMSPSSALSGWDLVLLPCHRHELPEKCKVCLILEKYKPSTSFE